MFIFLFIYLLFYFYLFICLFFFCIPATELQLNVIDCSSDARSWRKRKQDCVVFRAWDIGYAYVSSKCVQICNYVCI